jgi:transposase
MAQFILGIDIAKDKFDVCLVGPDQTYTGTFSNDPTGFVKLARWLQNRDAEEFHACLEATGRYGDSLALFLYGHGGQVSVVNPSRTKAYAESKLQRIKTDPVDAALIADFCASQKPDLWTPPAPEHQELQALVRHVEALKQDRQRERNRHASGIQSAEVLATIERHIAFLDQQIAELEERIQDHIDNHPRLRGKKDLLVSIPGIADKTAAKFMAEVPEVHVFRQAPQLAAYAGLTPRQHRSGSSVRGRSRLTKTGNAHLRTAFYMPALSAHRFNPIIANLRERLEARGKTKMTIIGAVMRKLLHLCYGVLKTGKPFDPNHAANGHVSA